MLLWVWVCSAVIQVSDTVRAVASNCEDKPINWVCVVSIKRWWVRCDSCAISTMADSTTGLMFSPAALALAVKLSCKDWPTALDKSVYATDTSR